MPPLRLHPSCPKSPELLGRTRRRGERDKELAEETARHFSFIAHEIRTPLNSAQLATQLLAGEGGERRDRHTRRLERSLGTLSELVDKFLVNAQQVGKPLAVEPQTHSARALAEAARDAVAYQAEQRGLPSSYRR